MGRDRQPELGARAVELDRAGVRGMRRDAKADLVRERVGDTLAHRHEALPDRLVRLAEDLEVDGSTEAELGACCRCGSAEAAVPDCGDPGAETVESTESGDRLHVLEVDPLLALYV